jgi:PAS domain S-box-containing protein
MPASWRYAVSLRYGCAGLRTPDRNATRSHRLCSYRITANSRESIISQLSADAVSSTPSGGNLRGLRLRLLLVVAASMAPAIAYLVWMLHLTHLDELGVLALCALAGSVVILLGVDRLVMRRVKVLSQLANAFSQGRLDERPVLRDNTTELDSLTQGLCEMADALQKREAAWRSAEDAREFGERMVQQLMDRSPSVIFIKDRHGRFQSVNAAYEKLLGRPRSELVGKTGYDFYPKELADAARKNDLEVEAAGEPKFFEEAATVHGELRRFMVTKFPMYGSDGALYGVGGISTDITESRKATEALRAATERFDLAVRGSFDGIWDWDIASGAVFLSPRFKALLGYQDHEIPGAFETWETRLHAEDRPRVLAAVQAHLEQREPYDVEYRSLVKDGSYRWFRARGQAVWDERGRATRMAGSITDITDYRHAVEALRQSEQRLEVALEAAEVGIWELDLETEAAERTPRHDQIFGYPALQPAWSLAHFRDHVLEADRAMFDRTFDRDRFNGRFDLQCRIRRADGAVRWIAVAGRILRGDDGEAARIVGTIADITERRRAEERFQATFEQAAVGIALVGPDGSWLRVNQRLCDIVGYPHNELLRMTFQDITHPDDLAADLGHVRQMLAGELQQYAMEKRYIRKDRSQIWINLTVTLVRQASGEPDYFISVVEDINERKQAEAGIHELNATLEARVRQRTEALQAANKELESFSYSVSHDLRTPLRAIDGFSRMLEEDHAARLGEDGRELLSVIRASTLNMGRLIDDLLAFSRAGRAEVKVVAIDMEELVQQVLAELGAAGRPMPAVHVDALPPGAGDPALLKQVWQNLLDNACKFSSRKAQARVEVDGEVSGNEVIYRVRDNGAGFDMRYAKKLFGVFQRLHSADEFPGTGVGLAMVQRIVAKHGGRVWADAKPGEGATFRFALPARE